jgi:hypothetical protein
MAALPIRTWYSGQPVMASKIRSVPFESLSAVSLYSSSDTSEAARIASDANWTHIAPCWSIRRKEAADQGVEGSPWER